eukprot:63285-Chlamydomonas_euryale.AAC.2
MRDTVCTLQSHMCGARGCPQRQCSVGGGHGRPSALSSGSCAVDIPLPRFPAFRFPLSRFSDPASPLSCSGRCAAGIPPSRFPVLAFPLSRFSAPAFPLSCSGRCAAGIPLATSIGRVTCNDMHELWREV